MTLPRSLNRRAFAFSLLGAPIVPLLPGREALLPAAERRYRSRSGEVGPVIVEVVMAPTERHARARRTRESRDPFDGKIGEFYIDEVTPVEVPDGVPGTVTTFATTVGAAAQEGTVHVGGFRRGLFVWTVRMHDGPAEGVIRAGEAIAGMRLPDPVGVRLVPGLMEGLLPGPEVFGTDIEEEGE